MKFIITGPSGVGKSHLINELMKQGFKAATRVSTREKRPDDISTDMRHVSHEEYQEMERNGEFLVSEEFGGNKYGFLKSEILNNSEENLLIVTWPDIVHLFIERAPGIIPIFLNAPDNQFLIDRMKSRQDTDEVIAKRMNLADQGVNYLNSRKDMFEKYGKIFNIQDNSTLYDQVIPWIFSKIKNNGAN